MGLPTEIGEMIEESQKTKAEESISCSFCGKKQNETKVIITGPNAYICGECVELSVDLIREENDPQFCHDKLELKDLKQILVDLAEEVWKKAGDKQKKNAEDKQKKEEK